MSTITIELRSDLCAATGTGYSSFVDTDVSSDRWGLPYIPARRLKGCLREAAEYIGLDAASCDRLFGTRGQDRPGILMISNGHLPEAEQIRRYLDGQKDQGNMIPPQRVLEIFTHIRASTAIDAATGTARQETLRYTRVVNQKKPGQSVPMTFVFDCEDDGDETTTQALERVCKALRHVGADRTRGLGAVSCRYCPTPAKEAAPLQTKDGGRKRMKLHLKLLDPLLITALSGDECVNYVSGAAVLGAFASLYLKDRHAADETFERLFLRGEVTYSNLYISDAAGTECIPAPYFIRKLKSSESAVDGQTLTFYDDKAGLIRDWMPEGTDGAALDRVARLAQPKPMRGKMLSRPALADAHTIMEYTVMTERTYHHSVHNSDRSMIWQPAAASDDPQKDGRQEKDQPNDASMYTHTAIMEGQYLSGTVEGPENLLRMLEQLLRKWPLRLGMSRSAQYSRCEPVKKLDGADGETAIAAIPKPASLAIGGGERLVIALESDFIPGTQENMIESIVRSVLPESFVKPEKQYDILMNETAMDYHMIHGYHAKRNLRNTPVRAAMMGSVITVRLLQPCQFDSDTLQTGRRRAEGFGAIHLYAPDALTGFRTGAVPDGAVPVREETDVGIDWFVQTLKAADTTDAIRIGQEIFRTFENSFNDRNITSSLVGRLMLMTEESETVRDMAARIDAIKKTNKRDACRKLFDAVCQHPIEMDGRTVRLDGTPLWKDCWVAVLRLARYCL